MRTSSPFKTGIGSSQRPAQGIEVAPSPLIDSSNRSAPLRQQTGPVHTRANSLPDVLPGAWREK
jgi:hypothetical protein